MSSLFDVTGDEIASLNDDDLRELVGRLCEADYRRANLALSGIFWGGHQDAADAGFDVSVEGNQAPPSDSFVPRPLTGFQVKKPKMPPSEITKEMLKDGILKKDIEDLVKRGGAYVIVSSGDSTTRGKALKNRIEAMENAIGTADGIHSPKLDFLDRGRLATWARQHPAVVLWIHGKLGKSLSGWKPYGNWAKALGGHEDIFLTGDNTRLSLNSERFEIEQGIQKIRTLLHTPRSSVRLIGLSGVGKTRLVQALFDDRVGENSLNPDLAVYTDIADAPNPDPAQIARQLIARREAAILVVDNCSRELHRKLTESASESNGLLSVLTIEYDVREDLPEETAVFRLEPTDDELLGKLLEREFPKLGHTNATTISRVSGGNFRLAIYIAKTVKDSESIGVLKDEDLFKRLFQQSHEHQMSLLESAEILSLLYSFDGTNIDEEPSELGLLSRLASKTPQELYKDSKIIADRELIQSRGQWRAILPHALANSLAKRALRKLHPKTVEQEILGCGSERTITSFSRRLSYLHESEEATTMVRSMLGDDGWIGSSIHNLSSFGFGILRNLAPVSPEAVLEGMERISESDQANAFYSKDNSHSEGFVRILFQIAYEDRYFSRASKLLALFSITESPDDNLNSIRDRLRTLYHIYLSGSHARAATRQKFLGDLLLSTEIQAANLGADLLSHALQTHHFVGNFSADFGARPRDYGSMPVSRLEIEEWYRPYMDVALQVAVSDNPVSAKVRKIMAGSFQDLWNAGFQNECESWVNSLLQKTSWVDAWRAVKALLHYDKDQLSRDEIERLKLLSRSLEPKTLAERLEYFVLNSYRSIFDPADDALEGEDVMKPHHRASKMAEQIGRELGRDETTFRSLVPICVVGEQGRYFELGKGIAQSGMSLSLAWEILKTALHGVDQKSRNAGIIHGFVWEVAEIDEDFYEATLDDVLSDPVMLPWFVRLQRADKSNARSVKRLHQVLDFDLVEPWKFRDLGYGRRHEHISDDELVGILEKILTKDHGDDIVMDILGMRFYGEENHPSRMSGTMHQFVRKALASMTLSDGRDRSGMRDHNLERVIYFAYHGGGFYQEAHALASRILNKSGHGFYFGDYDHCLESLAKTEPIALLDSWFGDEKRNKRFESNHRHEGIKAKSFVSVIPENVLFEWADQDCAGRYPRLAWHIQMVSGNNEEHHEWTDLALKCLSRSGNFSAMLDVFVSRIQPSSWSGSLADFLESRIGLLKQLKADEEDEIHLRKILSELEVNLQATRKSENERRQRDYLSFE
jgi:hypothetical protein